MPVLLQVPALLNLTVSGFTYTSCQHSTAVFIRVARAAHGLQVPTLRGPQDGRKWSGGKFSDMSAHQGEEAQNAG